ncbi:MAG: serine/threonine-protein phosphatase [Deltaproteobacteria bacterium]|nr:serine/threonine-protein phosphatase [Deltaproteobacteria bacterium]MBW1941221.1 serine/threonine-protein phosphatase [Deltaproteobacteria bacterium]MBW2206273.1 serine/threonine-protein phosphatase [Deltaproteobacteria bacterium]
MNVRVAGKSHVGLKRRLNEDSYLIAPDLGVYVIADGMGGHKAGEVASRMTVDTMTDYWRKMRSKRPPSFLETITDDISEEAKHLVNSISLTNAIVHEAQKKPEYHKMGSTVSALLTEKDRIWSANVGDSPIYLFESGRLVLISEEHSVEAEQRSMGISAESFGSTNPLLKNVLTRVLGLSEKVQVYITSLRPEEGDMVMICSDGLTNYLSENAIKTVLDDFSVSIERKVDILIDEANRGGGGDNITVILLEVLEEGKWNKFKKKFSGKS